MGNGLTLPVHPGCARCGSDHSEIRFVRLVNPVVKDGEIQYTHWAPCPITHEPILLIVRTSTGTIARRREEDIMGAKTEKLPSITKEKAMNNIPRRCDMLQHTEAEKAILAAMQVVESMGADIRLTDSVYFLEKALNAVSDFTDKVPRKAFKLEYGDF